MSTPNRSIILALSSLCGCGPTILSEVEALEDPDPMVQASDSGDESGEWPSGSSGSVAWSGGLDDGSTGDSGPYVADGSTSGGISCIAASAYRACDPECDQPCEDPAQVCLGPAGMEICTMYCEAEDPSPCPNTEFPAAWGKPACPTEWGFCTLPCDDLGLCPNPNVYECDESAMCWPDL